MGKTRGHGSRRGAYRGRGGGGRGRGGEEEESSEEERYEQTRSLGAPCVSLLGRAATRSASA
jgi:hypothetical protein